MAEAKTLTAMHEAALAQEKILIGRRQAAAALSISTRSLDYLIERGELRALRVGRRVLLRVADLEAWARRDHAGRITPGDQKVGGR